MSTQSNLFPYSEMSDEAPLMGSLEPPQRPLPRIGGDEGTSQTPSTDGSHTWYRGIMDRQCLSTCIVVIATFGLYFTVICLAPLPMADRSLRKVFVLFRHGTRAPGFTYKNDPYNKDDVRYWPDGPGELTATGKMEAYQLGERLRERYNGFIGDNYKAKEFRAYTTLVERTMMSAQLVLASLFLPKGYQDWNNQMQWQPIPIYPEEIVNATSASSCPRFTLEFKNNIKNLVSTDFSFETEIGKALKEHCGEPDASPFALFTRVWDTVYFQDRAHLPIPEWLKPIYPEKMTASAVRYLKFYLAGTPIQGLLLKDPFGRAITTFFTESPRKMEIHSLHDIHIMNLFLLLDIESNSFPEPGSAISIELHEKNEGQYFEVYYYPSPKHKVPVQMKMPCGMSCPLSDLIKRCQLFKVENYDELCNDAEGGVTQFTEFKLPF